MAVAVRITHTHICEKSTSHWRFLWRALKKNKKLKVCEKKGEKNQFFPLGKERKDIKAEREPFSVNFQLEL